MSDSLAPQNKHGAAAVVLPRFVPTTFGAIPAATTLTNTPAARDSNHHENSAKI